MKYQVGLMSLIVLLALALPGLARAEGGHTGEAPGAGGRATADPAAYQARLYALISACLQSRPGAANVGSLLGNLGNGNPLGALGAQIGADAIGGGAANTNFQAKCLTCHGSTVRALTKADSQTAIACIQGRCKAPFAQMPPGGPLPANEQQDIIKFLQAGG